MPSVPNTGNTPSRLEIVDPDGAWRTSVSANFQYEHDDPLRRTVVDTITPVPQKAVAFGITWPGLSITGATIGAVAPITCVISLKPQLTGNVVDWYSAAWKQRHQPLELIAVTEPSIGGFYYFDDQQSAYPARTYVVERNGYVIDCTFVGDAPESSAVTFVDLVSHFASQ